MSVSTPAYSGVAVPASDTAPAPTKPSVFLSVLRRAASPLVLLALWELASRAGVLPERVLAAPSQIFVTLGELIVSGEMGSNVLVS
ncbi:MAG TPA: ABC transporter permease, partial [Duganella sp.]